MRKGFTLVELSIVLVIVGLLIGGVLVAQSMINTAKITRSIQVFSQYCIAVANFKTKYNQVPGDSTLFGTGGNGDSLIGVSEIGQFWPNLSLGVGLKNESGTNFAAFDITTDVPTAANCPKLPIDKAASTSSYACLLGGDVSVGGVDANYFAYDYTPADTTSPSPIMAADALALDSKLDDGVATTGRILGSSYNLSCYNVTDYKTGSNDRCYLFLKLDTVTRQN